MRSKNKCPHENIVDCPLYHAMHVAGGPSCLSRDLQDGCLVDQGTDYEGLLMALRIKHPKLVAECEWDAAIRQSKEKRSTGMRAAGLH